MIRQRWGTFSVRDHVAPQPFAAEVLLYDRLIIPVSADANERTHWAKDQRDPDRLDQLLDILRADGEEQKRHAITVPWSEQTRQLFRQRVEIANIVHGEANLNLTRQLLAQDLRPPAPEGVTPVAVMAAYRSVQEAEKEWVGDDSAGARTILTAALATQFLVPQAMGRSDLELLREVVDLADDSNFQRKRARLYEWQDEVLRAGKSIPEAVDEMAQYVSEYNAVILAALRHATPSFAFTLAPVGASAASGLLGVPAALAAAAQPVEFAIYDRRPKLQFGACEAGAVFYTIQQRLGWKQVNSA